MFLSKKAFSWTTLPLAVVVVVAGIFGLVWLDADPAEARGRSATLIRNDVVAPESAVGAGNAPCLQSLVKWAPLGSKVEVDIVLQRRIRNSSNWWFQDKHTQLLPGKTNGVVVEWEDVVPGFEYRHFFRMYSVNGKDGAYRNHQLAGEMSPITPEVASCGE